MVTIVLDINCFLQVIPKRAPKRWLYDLILQGELTMAVSSEILLEYSEVIERKTNASIAGNITSALVELPNVRKINPSYFWQMIREDADDNKYVDCAVAANADYIISDDKHFNALRDYDFPILTRLKLNQVEKFIMLPDT